MVHGSSRLDSIMRRRRAGAWAGRTILFRHETHRRDPPLPACARARSPPRRRPRRAHGVGRRPRRRPPSGRFRPGSRRRWPSRTWTRRARPRSRSTSPPARSCTGGTARSRSRPRRPRSSHSASRSSPASARSTGSRRASLGSGGLDGATWRGDVVLEGAGDPTLSSAALARLAAQVRAQGIRRVEGRVVGDESFFDTRRTAPGWKARYFIGESPPLSALVVDRAQLRRTTSRTPALAAAVLFRDALRRAGVAVDRRGRRGTRPRRRTPCSRGTCRPRCSTSCAPSTARATTSAPRCCSSTSAPSTAARARPAPARPS